MKKRTHYWTCDGYTVIFSRLIARLMLMWSQYGAIDDAVSHSRSIYYLDVLTKNGLSDLSVGQVPMRLAPPCVRHCAMIVPSSSTCHPPPDWPWEGRDPVTFKTDSFCSFLSVLQENICPILMLSPPLLFTHPLFQPITCSHPKSRVCKRLSVGAPVLQITKGQKQPVHNFLKSK